MTVPAESRMRAAIDWANCGDEWLGWKHVKPITKEHLKNGAGPIQHISAREALGLTEEKQESKVMPFGKYKGKTKAWIEENDENYFNWAEENLPVFQKL